MIVRQHDVDRLGPEKLHLASRGWRCFQDEARVHPQRSNSRDMVARRAFDDLKFHVGVLREKRLKKLAWSAARDRGDDPDAQAPSLPTPFSAAVRSRLCTSLRISRPRDRMRTPANVGCVPRLCRWKKLTPVASSSVRTRRIITHGRTPSASAALRKLPCSRTSRARCNPTRSSIGHQASHSPSRFKFLRKLPCSRTSRARCNPTRSSIGHQASHSPSRFKFRCARTLCHCLLLPMQPRNADCRPATKTGCAEFLISQRAMPGQHRVSANFVSKATAPPFPLRRHGMCATAVQASLSDA